MKAYQIIRKYMKDNGIRLSYVSERTGMDRELLQRSLNGKRTLKADEFLKICTCLSLDLEQFDAGSPKINCG